MAAQLIFSQFALFPPPNWLDPNGNPIPYSVNAQVKLKPDTLDNDMSVPRISHIWDALIEFTLSSLYTRARNLTKADSREQKAIAHVQAAVQVEKNQSESFQQVVPTIYDTGNYFGQGAPVSTSYPWGSVKCRYLTINWTMNLWLTAPRRLPVSIIRSRRAPLARPWLTMLRTD